MVSVAVALIVAMATIQSTQASIDFWLQKPTSFQAGFNSITVHCKNGGGMDGVMTERLEPLEGGKTRVSIAGETTVHAGPLARFGESFLAKYMDHSIEMAMAAAKAHIEEQARAATPS